MENNLYYLPDMAWPEIKEALRHIQLAIIPVNTRRGYRTARAIPFFIL